MLKVVIIICGMSAVFAQNSGAQNLDSVHQWSQEQIQSIMDPHPPKDVGPWFEGWYTRWVDFEENFSLALITTSYLPKGVPYRQEETMPGYISLAFQMPGRPRLQVFELFPDDTFMTSGGSRRLVDRRWIEETQFSWISKKYGKITQDQVFIEAPGLFKFESDFSTRTPWSEWSDNLGPGHITAFLRFIPLHWYVFSLRTETTYRFTNYTSGEQIEGTAWAHQEKNWGEVFPASWIWLQALSTDGADQVALAGGQADLGFFSTEAFIGTARLGGLAVDFSPLNMRRIRKQFDSCAGTIDLSFQTFTHQIEISAAAPTESFGLLSIPTKEGYLPGASESFVGEMTVKIYRTSLLRHPQFLREANFSKAALEFGGGYLECWPEY